MSITLFVIIVIISFLAGACLSAGLCEHALALAEFDISELEIELEEYKQDVAVLESYLSSSQTGIEIEIIDERKEDNFIEL